MRVSKLRVFVLGKIAISIDPLLIFITTNRYKFYTWRREKNTIIIMSSRESSTARMRDEFLDSTHPVSRQEPIFNKLEYQIRLSLNSVSASIYRLYSIKTPNEVDAFKNSCNHAYTDVWLNMNDETMRNYPVERVVVQGFFDNTGGIDDNGLMLKTGHLVLNRETMQDHTLINNTSRLDISLHGGKRKKIFKLLHTLVAPGKCYFVSSDATQVSVPSGYDSLYIQPRKYYSLMSSLTN
jgi:hypothetical protein